MKGPDKIWLVWTEVLGVVWTEVWSVVWTEVWSAVPVRREVGGS
jgi:hypothetical protein